ncbi:hypothetical protein J5N97_005634 [Dioscorea zingiberensis]|uniref:Uncharacterized protein n=1 Tax=Dioscorea zingiberensis TaxID=325984 RepID=A0A9D5DAM2_9LILI|nr:hypothetical protein J5N97_005634 [Dioscorea zingiberensis]
MPQHTPIGSSQVAQGILANSQVLVQDGKPTLDVVELNGRVLQPHHKQLRAHNFSLFCE